MNRFKIIMTATACLCSASACSNDEPARITWEAEASPAQNFEIMISPSFHPSVVIEAGADAGRLTLRCTNYSHVFIDSEPAVSSYRSEACAFTITKTGDNTFELVFDSVVPDNELYDFIYTVASDGKDAVYSTIAICRKGAEEQ